jgi:hypothetical protein
MAKDLQFSARHDATQDRMLLLASFPDGTEIRVWMTRRLVRNLIGMSGQVAERMVPQQVVEPEVKKEVARFQREAAVQKANFRKDFEGGTPHPELGGEAHLVTEIRIAPKDGGSVHVKLALDNGKFVAWQVPSPTFWGLMHLIERQAQRAEWDLCAKVQKVAEEPRLRGERPPAKDKPRLN